MEISKAKFTDIPEIVAIQKLAFYNVAKFHNNFRLRPLQVTIGDLEKTFSEYTYIIASENNYIVGSAKAKIENNVCKIESVIVHPDYQNRGIGKKLMSTIESEFNSCSAFSLFTGKDTPKNVSFYSSLGYRIISETQATETEPVIVIMEKENV